MSKIDSMEALLEDNLKDIYSAEKQLIKALPKMAKAASSPALKNAFESHLEETEGQIERLEKIAGILDIKLTGKKCKAMEGLIEEGSEAMEMEGVNTLIDAALIVAAQKVEHYEMSAYGSARTFSECIGQKEVAELLEKTRSEEEDADNKLTDICMEDLLADYKADLKNDRPEARR